MPIRFPSRYEDLDQAFRGRLKPVPELIELVHRAQTSISINGGLRFLPIFGESGSGKSSAARELSTHLPETKTISLPREAIESFSALKDFLIYQKRLNLLRHLVIVVVDQYEEAVAKGNNLPRQFVEWLSLLDRDPTYCDVPWLFLWLTTDKEF
jgi:ABC-type glutathione transport system ATPase component